jgi:hypothetical protein
MHAVIAADAVGNTEPIATQLLWTARPAPVRARRMLSVVCSTSLKPASTGSMCSHTVANPARTSLAKLACSVIARHVLPCVVTGKSACCNCFSSFAHSSLHTVLDALLRG